MEWLKSHKKIAFGILGVLIVAYLYLRGSSGGSASASSGADIYGIQAAAQAQQSHDQASLAAAGLAASTQIESLKIAGQNQISLAQLNQSVALADINAKQQTTDLANTLTANVAEKQIQGQTDVAGITSQTQIQTTKFLTDALIQQISASEKETMAAIDASHQSSGGCSGFISCLFG